MRYLAQRLMLMWGWQRHLAAFLAGALSVLALRPVSFAPILFLTFPALVVLIDGAVVGGPDGLRRLRPAAATGWWFGFGYFLAGLHWVGAAFLAEGRPILIPLMPVAVLALSAGFALFTAFGALVARILWTDGPMRILALSFGLGISEWLRGQLFTGFPWNLFGQAVAFTDVTAQAASVIGVQGLTALGIAVFAAPALLGDEPERRGWPFRLMLIAAVGLVALDVGYGIHRLAGAAPVGTATVAGARIRIVQPNINQAQKWTASYRDATLKHLVALSDAKTGPDALGALSFSQIIWPETALPYFLTDWPAALEAIADLLPPGTSLVTGAPRAEPTPEGWRFYNSAYVIDDGGAIVDAYDKVHLLPFGEYMPFSDFLRRIGVGALFKGIGGFSPGPRRQIVRMSGLPSFSILICYEAIFPGEVTDGDERPDYFVNITNDGWFGHTAGPYQHLDEVRLRAVEEGRPFVRAANTGISAIIDGYGRIVASLPLGEDGTLDGMVPSERPSSQFPRMGEEFLLTYYGLSAIGLVLAKRKQRRRS